MWSKPLLQPNGGSHHLSHQTRTRGEGKLTQKAGADPLPPSHGLWEAKGNHGHDSAIQVDDDVPETERSHGSSMEQAGGGGSHSADRWGA